MVNVRPPPRPVIPEPPPGMTWHVYPWHSIWLSDYEYYDRMGRDPLQRAKIWSIASPEERVQKLKEVLEEYPKQMHRRNMLLSAAARGDEAVVRALVETGLKVHPEMRKPQHGEEANEDNNRSEDRAEYQGVPDKDDPTVCPFHGAATRGHLGCVKIFVEEGKVEVDVRDELGRTPLIGAAKYPEIMRYLLAHGADPMARTETEGVLVNEYLGVENGGTSVLDWAAAYGNVEGLKMLLEHSACVSARECVTPRTINYAAMGSFESLKLLLEQGGYPTRDKDGITKNELLSDEQRTAIVDATATSAEFADMESIKLLLSYQFPIDSDGNVLPFEVPETLHMPFIRGAYDAMAKNRVDKFEFIDSLGLKEHEAMSLDKLPEGQRLNLQHLLEKAAEAGSIDCVKLMIEKYGAVANRHRVPPGVQPLYVAAARDRSEVVRYLLENHNVDIHLGSGRYATGPTALWIAIHLKALDSIVLLLQHGGPLDYIGEELRNIEGPSAAILKAVQKGSHTEVRLETEENAREYVELACRNWQALNRPFVRLDLDAEDKKWINTIQLRKGDESLREKGNGARELNRQEGAAVKDLDDADIRKLMAPVPTFLDREAELEEYDDLIPRWRSAAGPARTTALD